MKPWSRADIFGLLLLPFLVAASPPASQPAAASNLVFQKQFADHRSVAVGIQERKVYTGPGTDYPDPSSAPRHLYRMLVTLASADAPPRDVGSFEYADFGVALNGGYYFQVLDAAYEPGALTIIYVETASLKAIILKLPLDGAPLLPERLPFESTLRMHWHTTGSARINGSLKKGTLSVTVVADKPYGGPMVDHFVYRNDDWAEDPPQSPPAKPKLIQIAPGIFLEETAPATTIPTTQPSSP
jgi:hypothetical protein